ncbi:MAG: PAS domain-containing protein, partial [Verrucomicrobiota bacterium]
MWPVLITLLVAGLLALHFWRWRRSLAMRGELERVKKALAESEERHRETEFEAHAQLQTLFNSMAEGVMLLDPQGRIQLLNQSLERQFNLALDVRGLTVLEALRRPELASLIGRLKTARQVVSVEIELDGASPRALEANAASILDRDGQPRGTILVFHDLTRIRQVLFNVVSNASKFTKQGKITVEISRRSEEGRDWISFRLSEW